MIARVCILFSLLLICSCQGEYDRLDSNFSQHKQYTFYKNTPFSGVQISSFNNGKKKSITPFKDGLKQGISYKWHSNGVLASERPYHQGEKQGTHRGWHLNGKKKFYYQFDKGRYQGETWQWFANGNVSDYTLNNDTDELVHKKWRRSGSIFWNTVKSPDVREAIYGLRGGGLCRKIEDEEGVQKRQSISSEIRLSNAKS
ncbi:MAG: hypothetical protein KUG82_16325 [Pseudomonadales bacterium]|nr:hypothetical protein [Pseudomonadales bacterium]